MVCLSVCNKRISGGLQLGPSGAELGEGLDGHGEKQCWKMCVRLMIETPVT